MIDIDKEMNRSAELQKILINNDEDGEKLIAEINETRKQAFLEMQEDIDNDRWDKLDELRYELKTARHNIRTQRASIFINTCRGISYK